MRTNPWIFEIHSKTVHLHNTDTIIFTFGTAVPKVTGAGTCAVCVLAMSSFCFLIVRPPTPIGVTAVGVVTFFITVPAGGVTGVEVCIFTVIAGVVLMGVAIDDCEIVRATTGLERT